MEKEKIEKNLENWKNHNLVNPFCVEEVSQPIGIVEND